MTITNKLLIVVLVILNAIPERVYAEASSSSSNNNTAQLTQMYQSSLDSLNKQNQQLQQQAQDSDRAKKSGGADAQAIAGAAMAGMMCMLMMKKAMEEEDPQMKQMYMMMAMQQCQQAAQNKESSDKNKEGQKALTMNDSPKLPDLSQNQETPATTTPTDTTVPQLTTRDPVALDIPAADPIEVGPAPVATGIPLDPGAVQPNMGNANLGIDEKADQGNPPNTNSGMGTVIGGVPARAVASDEALKKNAIENAGTLASGKKVKTSGEGEGSGSSDGGGSSGGSSKSDGGLDAMLSQMMGGGAASSQDALGSGSDVVSFGATGGSAKSVPNIFEYASFRYKNLTFQEGRVVPKKLNLAMKSPLF